MRKNKAPFGKETDRDMQESIKSKEQSKEEIADLRPKEELHMIKKKYTELFERTDVGIAIIQDRLLKYANKYLAELMGYTVDELTDSPFGVHVHPEELPKMVNLYMKRISGEDVQSKCKSAIKDKKANKISVEIEAVKITYQGKSADLVSIRDIAGHRLSLDRGANKAHK